MFSYSFDEYMKAHLREREREVLSLQRTAQVRLVREPGWRWALAQLRTAFDYSRRLIGAVGHVPHRRAS
jgi:hypothetical protein